MASFNRTLCEINGELVNNDGSKTQLMVDNDVSCAVLYCVLFLKCAYWVLQACLIF